MNAVSATQDTVETVVIDSANCKTMNKKSISRKPETEANPTQSRTFKLPADELKFFELLSEKNIMPGLRKLIAFCRAAGCPSENLKTSSAEITLTFLVGIERLELTLQELTAR